MKLLNKNRKTSKEIAKDRLKVVLIHDRANLSPEIMQCLKNDMEISLENDSDSVALLANIPITRIKAKKR